MSLAEYDVPNSGVNKMLTDVNGLWVFDAYSAIPTLLAKQLVKVICLQVVNRLATEVF